MAVPPPPRRPCSPCWPPHLLCLPQSAPPMLRCPAVATTFHPWTIWCAVCPPVVAGLDVHIHAVYPPVVAGLTAVPVYMARGQLAGVSAAAAPEGQLACSTPCASLAPRAQAAKQRPAEFTSRRSSLALPQVRSVRAGVLVDIASAPMARQCLHAEERGFVACCATACLHDMNGPHRRSPLPLITRTSLTALSLPICPLNPPTGAQRFLRQKFRRFNDAPGARGGY